jgi:hypothetical protein
MQTEDKLARFAPKMFGVKNKGDYALLTLPSNRTARAEYVGRGRFSNVFRLSPTMASVNYSVDAVWEARENVIIYTKHGDLSKDILCHVDKRKRNPHIPKMSYLGTMFRQTIDVYQSSYCLTPVRKIMTTENDWATIKALRMAHAEACAEFRGDIIAKNQCIDFNYFIANNADVPEKMTQALTLIADSAQDWGKYYLFDDFRAKNLGLDEEGRLVLLDAMFDAALIQKRGGDNGIQGKGPV